MSIGKFSKEVGISINHLRLLHKTGELVPVKITKGGTRYYSDKQLNDYLGLNEKDKKVMLYARVSTKQQKDDLENQIKNLKEYAYSKGYNFEIISDIGSGIDYKKEGLKKLLERINNSEISKIVILYKDRLVSFGFELIEFLANINNIEIEIIDNTTVSKEEELTNDLIQIVTVFANKLYGSRSKKTKQLIDGVKNVSN
jgi:DNA binding domain, excisionase family